jgi:DUF4097 and DUF4098 domain-containing protein YvlB
MRADLRHQVVLGLVGGVLFVAVLGLSVGGCVVVSSGVAGSMGMWDDRVKATVTDSIDHVAGKPLWVETGNGEIEVVKSEGAQVRVTAELTAKDKARLEGAKLSLVRDADGKLRVSVLWPDGKRKPYEGAGMRVEIPDVASMELKTGNGRIRTANFSGALVAETSNGEIEVTDHNGTVKADTSNGAILLRNVGNVVADTSNGAIEVSLRDDATGPVKMDSSNGALSLTVGKAFVGTIKADTSNGGVLATCARASKVTVKKTSAEIVYGSATVEYGKGEESVLDTSNGTVTINEH